MDRFSERHGFGVPDADIRFRNEAPDEMRNVILDIAYELGFSSKLMRRLICQVLRKGADPNNWDNPNVEQECQRLIHNCEWYEVYDIIEQLYLAFQKPQFYDHQNGPYSIAEEFAQEINRYFGREGIGWQLTNGTIEIRGPESFETAVHEAIEVLSSHGNSTASSELHEAIRDLSRRPTPDVTGAVQHAMSALECIAREICGNCNLTLGEVIKRHSNTFPKPLDQAVEKLWGYSSESGRHLKEGSPPNLEEAELVVGLSGVLCRYLARKLQ